MKGSISWLVYLVAWLVLMLVQSLLIGNGSATAEHFWVAPSHYLSTWMLDFFLIGLFYLNYYMVSRSMMQRRHFAAYAVFTVVMALFALFIPIICKSLFGWRTPTQDLMEVTGSWVGAVGVVSVVAIGLAMRAVREWLSLLAKNKEQTTELQRLKSELNILKAQMQITPTETTPEQSVVEDFPRV